MASNLSRFRSYEAVPLARLEGGSAEHSLNLTLRPCIEHLLAVLPQCSVGGDMPVQGLSRDPECKIAPKNDPAAGVG